jgi:RNA polymerase sigma-70 factor (ECF subfamily)
MGEMDQASAKWPSSPAQFATTLWSVVLTAQAGTEPEAEVALERLCRAYWPPLYGYVRRQGYGPAEAQDLTQEFFARLIERNYLAHLRHQQGRFRSFLLTFLKHFLLEQQGRARAQKRGGGRPIVSIEQMLEEDHHALGADRTCTPDEAYDRRWAETILAGALNRLRADYAAAGQGALFEALKDFQPREPGGRSYAEIGAALGMSEAAVKSAAQRLRHRHRELVREEIAQTVTRAEEIEDEMRHLRVVLSRSG